MLFRAVKCYKCDTYQVDSVKKVNKWQCRMCGEKQSLQGEYASGSAKDCRLQVQRLNMMKAERDVQKTDFAEKILSGEIHFSGTEAQPPGECSVKGSSSKWADLGEEAADEGEKGSIFSNPVNSGNSLWKDIYNKEISSMKNERDFQKGSSIFSPASKEQFKAITSTKDSDSIFPEDVEEKPKPPTWKDFYGKKRQTTKQKNQTDDNSKRFFGSADFSSSARNRSMPLPKLLDYKQLVGGNKPSKNAMRARENAELDENESRFLPSSKKFRATD
ncbi:uncharacterized protein LOC129797692 [Lutzomyia longipalpis]|uniref:uncharacterized protein LOC129797692 n=1 Tax=Lutzomyia longipalpis TaxID=7200 RepID=UPI0024835B5F|nr:uncharacterized protein LOC129797692 [Lutzomyia longipalpis]